jgi:hypothetical protein
MEIDLPKELILLYRRGGGFGREKFESVNETARFFAYQVVINGYQKNLLPIQLYALKQVGFEIQYYSYYPKMKCETLDLMEAKYLGMYKEDLVEEEIKEYKKTGRRLRNNGKQGAKSVIPPILDPRVKGTTYNNDFNERLLSGLPIPERPWINVDDILTEKEARDIRTKMKKEESENSE